MLLIPAAAVTVGYAIIILALRLAAGHADRAAAAGGAPAPDQETEAAPTKHAPPPSYSILSVAPDLGAACASS